MIAKRPCPRCKRRSIVFAGRTAWCERCAWSETYSEPERLSVEPPKGLDDPHFCERLQEILTRRPKVRVVPEVHACPYCRQRRASEVSLVRHLEVFHGAFVPKPAFLDTDARDFARRGNR